MTWVDYFACLFVHLNLLSHGVSEKKKEHCISLDLDLRVSLFWQQWGGMLVVVMVVVVFVCLFYLWVLWDLCSGLKNPLLVDSIPAD